MKTPCRRALNGACRRSVGILVSDRAQVAEAKVVDEVIGQGDRVVHRQFVEFWVKRLFPAGTEELLTLALS